MFPRRTPSNARTRVVADFGPDPIWSILQPAVDAQTTNFQRLAQPEFRWGMAERVSHADLGALQGFIGWPAATEVTKGPMTALPATRVVNDQISAVLQANGSLGA